MDTYDIVIVATFFGFTFLAIALLAPVYLFLKREREAGEKWTREARPRDPDAAPPRPNGAPRVGEAREGRDDVQR